MIVINYEVTIKTEYGKLSIQIKGRVESNNFITALKFLANDQRYYSVVLDMQTGLPEDFRLPSNVRYLSSKAARDSALRAFPEANISDLVFDMDIGSFNPRIELLYDDLKPWPILELTNEGWKDIPERQRKVTLEHRFKR